MTKDVWISISNRQHDGPNGENTMIFDTAGSYFFDEEGVSVVSYQESELTGLEGTRTSVMIMPNQVVVDRAGMLTGRMIFREGMRDSYPYDTPYGQLTLGIDTRSIRHSFDEKGGSMEIDYVTDLANTFVAKNHFQISVKEMEKKNG
ncbi:MAG: DUF1934 domain-containing protein [Oscillospiraceae bacterium]|nr:DUF1934 domain-containing protein [Oscillospiraceae bacterium]